MVEAICNRFQLTNVCEIRGASSEFELLKREIYDIKNWNLILIAIAFDNIPALKLFTKTCHLRVAFRQPPILSFSKMQEASAASTEMFPLLLTINNKNEEMLKVVWNEYKQVWDSFHLLPLLEELCLQKWSIGIKAVL